MSFAVSITCSNPNWQKEKEKCFQLGFVISTLKVPRKKVNVDPRHKRIDCIFAWIASLILVASSYIASHHLALAPQSGAKDQFYSTVDCITLNSYNEAQKVSKNLKKVVEE
jgi:hypothetical protein